MSFSLDGLASPVLVTPLVQLSLQLEYPNRSCELCIEHAIVYHHHEYILRTKAASSIALCSCKVYLSFVTCFLRSWSFPGRESLLQSPLVLIVHVEP